ncbi:MFS transporter [Paenibacillus cisolokensis]|uniref:MFS transporter n=1 Tax=Paenibacillus cisolokensis TaxID=1658519 RepID=UPI003D2AACB0
MKTLASYYFLFYLAVSCFYPYISLYFSERGLSNTEIGLIMSIWAFVSLISQPLMGIVNDRMRDPRVVLMVSVLAAPLLSLGFYYLDSFTAMLALSVIFAWFHTSAAPLSDAIAVDIGSRKGYPFGNIRLWGALSYSLGAFFTGFLFEKHGYENLFFYFVAVSMLVFLCLFQFPKTKASVPRITVFEQAREVIRNRRFMIFSGISLLVVMSMAGNSTFLPIYFVEMGFDKTWVGTAAAIAAMVEVPMFWFAAKLSGKIGNYAVLCIGAAAYAIRCLLLFSFHHVFLTLALQLLDGLAYAFVTAVAVEIVERFASNGTKATFQLVYAAITGSLGGIIGNAAGGALVDWMGTPFLYLILFVLCAAAAILYAATGNMRYKAARMTKISS